MNSVWMLRDLCLSSFNIELPRSNNRCDCVEYSKTQAMAELFGIRQRYKALAFSYYNLGISIESGTDSTAVSIGTVCQCQKFLCIRHGHTVPYFWPSCNFCADQVGPWPVIYRSGPVQDRSRTGLVLGPRHAPNLVFGPGRSGPILDRCTPLLSFRPLSPKILMKLFLIQIGSLQCKRSFISLKGTRCGTLYHGQRIEQQDEHTPDCKLLGIPESLYSQTTCRYISALNF